MSDRDQDRTEKDNKVADLLKKLMNTGIGAAFMTEEVVKGLLSEISVPKDILQNLIQGAKSSKEEFLNSVKNGVKEYFKQYDVSKEIDRILENYDIEFEAKFSFKKKKDKKT